MLSGKVNHLSAESPDRSQASSATINENLSEQLEEPEEYQQKQPNGAGNTCDDQSLDIRRSMIAPESSCDQKQQLQVRQHQQETQEGSNKLLDYEEVKQVELFGVSIVALTISGRERLCLAQISNTLLKQFSYNEIHNRRVALGITCVQCTPIQLEMLRRAGAMPSSSRRCGMITMREALRLCRSFLVEEQPPELPENFYFTVAHRVNYGCKGRFVPARYISSRAKCIECFYCGDFYSPNKFIFHSHRQPQNTDCNPPDSPNINSWRKHIDLDASHEHSQEIKYAWEDVKSLFNGGTRRRIAPTSQSDSASADFEANNAQASRRKQVASYGSMKRQEQLDEQLLIDVECNDDNNNNNKFKLQPPEGQLKQHSISRLASSSSNQHKQQPNNQQSKLAEPVMNLTSSPIKRSLHLLEGCSSSKRFSVSALQSSSTSQLDRKVAVSKPSCSQSFNQINQNANMDNYFNQQSTSRRLTTNDKSNQQVNYNPNNSSNFIYSQLYDQLILAQPQQTHQTSQMLDPQLALRHHLWSSLLANLQYSANSAANQPYGLCQAPQPTQNQTVGELSHLLSSHLYSSQVAAAGKLPGATSRQPTTNNLIEAYKPFGKYPTSDANEH